MCLHKILIEQRSLDHRHIGCDNVKAFLKRIHLPQHLGALAGKRNDDHDVLAQLGYRIRQLAYTEPVKQVAAGKFIAGEHRRGTDAQTVKLREDLVCAVAHAIQRDRACFFLQSAPDRLFQC